MPDKVLAVCTANICRSPVTERLLADALGGHALVSSAGVRAVPGAPGCVESQSWLSDLYRPRGRSRHAVDRPEHVSQPLSADLIEQSALILTATREHRSAIIRLVPQAQNHTFTLAQAARIATWQTGQGVVLPTDGDRLRSLVDALDAGRADAPRPAQESDDDLPDPHERETTHAEMLPQIYQAVAALAGLVAAG